ncbi:Glutamate racemase, partial [Haemophilus influenzae]
IYGDLNLWK